MLDALTHYGVWADDSQIDKLLLVRQEQKEGGEIIVVISELENG